MITHQDVVNEIEVEPMRLVGEHSSQITLRNHYESVFGSLAAPSPSPQEIEISEPEIDSGYAECGVYGTETNRASSRSARAADIRRVSRGIARKGCKILTML